MVVYESNTSWLGKASLGISYLTLHHDTHGKDGKVKDSSSSDGVMATAWWIYSALNEVALESACIYHKEVNDRNELCSDSTALHGSVSIMCEFHMPLVRMVPSIQSTETVQQVSVVELGAAPE